jgi:SAM-dependent methyltransferase
MADLETEYGYDTTYCEWLAKTRWGAYIAEIENRAIMLGHRAAGDPSHALEIGCEGGRWSLLLTQLGWTMTCTDVMAGHLEICRRRLPAATCVLVSPTDSTLPCETGSIGLLLCVGVPPAIQSPWFIAEAHRVLKKDGILVGTFWNLLSLRGLGQHLYALCTGGSGQYRFAYPPWRRKLSAAGFRMLHEEGYCWFPFRRASNSGLVPYAVGFERTLRLGQLAAVSPWVAFTARKTSE